MDVDITGTELAVIVGILLLVRWLRTSAPKPMGEPTELLIAKKPAPSWWDRNKLRVWGAAGLLIGYLLWGR